MLLRLLVPEAGSPRGLADTIAIVLALGYGTVMMTLGDAARPDAAIPWQADLALGVAGAGALLVRRRHPLLVTGLLLPFGAISVAVTGPILVALFTAAIRLPFRPVLLLGAVNVATGGIYFLLQDRPARDIWVDFVVRGVVTMAALGWGSFVRAYRRLTTSLREHAARLEAEQELREEQARLGERARIAREMHDVIAHRMSLISLHAGALEVRAAVGPASSGAASFGTASSGAASLGADELAVAAGAIRRSAREALEELRAVVGAGSGRDAGAGLGAGQSAGLGAPGGPGELSGSGMPAGLVEPPQPGIGDLDDLVGSVRAAGMAVDFDSVLPGGGPPVVVGRAVYRIVQEGLTNAGKHGSAPAATVRVEGVPGRDLRITISNPVSGGPAAGAGGLGLVGIGERVALAGGTYRYGAEHGVFRLEAALPWPADPADLPAEQR
ncbi:sensor histidine kinase [Actinoplanes palleronii]|nr:histidine kinase [Actinoplanes palleronii]